MKTEKEKMLAGELYDPLDPELASERRRARELCRRLNDSGETNQAARELILRELLGNIAAGLWVEPPFFCDYGSNIAVGNKVYFNFNCVVLDPAPVLIGDNVLFGPAVQIYTATHPLDANERRIGLEFARPIQIGSNVWIGGGAIICPGVRIGARSVIGAGSVVTRDIPEEVFAAGNPCRTIRALC
jgi:maltose O-acetyltransferase